MRYRSMGESGLKVSVLGLGTMNFGNKAWGCDEKNSIEIINSYIEKGGNFIDTANFYGDEDSEIIIGKAIRNKRSKLIISTKCAAPLMSASVNDKGLSKYNIINSVENSLKKLNTDYIDLFYIHFPDPSTPFEETMRSLTNLVKSGKVRYVGASNFAGWQISEMASLWKNNLLIEPLISIQSEYSLISRFVEYEVLPSCRYNKLGFVCYSPLGGGVLAGIYKKDKSGPNNERYTADDDWSKSEGSRYLADKHLSIAEEVEKIAKEIGTSLPILSLAWCINKRDVTAALIGARDSAQLNKNIEASELRLDKDIVQKMDAISSPDVPFEYGKLIDYIKIDFKDLEYKNLYY